MKTALAIMAKTIGLSPVKTRLAEDVGVQKAEEFYALSVQATTEIAYATQGITPYFAVAEQEAASHQLWQDFPTIWTGDGGFGQRLHNIYSTLLKTHYTVMMIGTDSPQITPQILLDAVDKLQEKPESCIIGPCTDGGFYLFAAGITIPEKVWTNVGYSKTTTLQELITQLSKYNIDVSLLPQQGDVDTENDLSPLINSLKANKNGSRQD